MRLKGWMRHDQRIAIEIRGKWRVGERREAEGEFIQVLAMQASTGDLKSSPAPPHANGKVSVMSREPEINTSW